MLANHCGSQTVKRSRRYPLLLWLLVLGALFGSVQFGYQQGVLNTAWPQLSETFQYYEVDSWYTSFISFSYLFGAVLGALGSGNVADACGPKQVLLINSFVFIAGTLVSVSAIPAKIGLFVFSFGRLLCGVGAGAASLLSPRLIAEISPINLRGTLGTLTQLFICLGVMLSFIAGVPYELQGEQVPDWQWRFMLLIAVIFPISQIVVLFMSPESPEWLAMKGRYDAMLWTQICLYGDMFRTESEPFIKCNDSGYQQIFFPVSLRELFSRKYSRFMRLGILIVMFQQASGINTVIMYSTTVYQQANLDNAVLASIATGVINVLGTLVSTALIEKVGRKVLCLVSHLGMFVCLGYVTVSEWVSADSLMGSYAVLAAILLYILLFSVGVGPVGWLYLTEILPARIKGKAAAIATALNWVTVMIVVATFPVMMKWMGTGPSYGVFAIINFVAFIYLWFDMVETKQVSVDQIEKILLREDEPLV